MKRLAVLLVFTLFLSGCAITKETPLDGLWTTIKTKFSVIIEITTGSGPEKTVEEFARAVINKDYQKAVGFFQETSRQEIKPENLEGIFAKENFETFQLGDINLQKEGATV